jgi:hypothetical protein
LVSLTLTSSCACTREITNILHLVSPSFHPTRPKKGRENKTVISQLRTEWKAYCKDDLRPKAATLMGQPTGFSKQLFILIFEITRQLYEKEKLRRSHVIVMYLNPHFMQPFAAGIIHLLLEYSKIIK